jgi:serine protease inhibitor
MCKRGLIINTDVFGFNVKTRTCLCIACIIAGTYRPYYIGKGPFQLIRFQEDTSILNITIPRLEKKEPQFQKNVIPIQKVMYPIPYVPATLLPKNESWGKINVYKPIVPILLSIPILSPSYYIDAYNQFALHLLLTIRINTEYNTIISPLSFAISLCMFAELSDVNMDAYIQILHLFFNKSQNLGELAKYLFKRIINTHIINERIITAFQDDNKNIPLQSLKIIKENFKGEYFTNNSNLFMEDWISKRINKKIENVLQQKTRSVNVNLIDIISFKNRWKFSFKKEMTYNSYFYTDFSFKVGVSCCEMMNQVGKFKYVFGGADNNPSWQAISIPYANEDIEAIIILDNNPLSTLSQSFSSYIEQWSEIWKMFQNAQYESIDIHIPKFSLQISQNLIEISKQIGLDRIYDSNSGILSKLKLNTAIDSIDQLLFLEINEDGDNIVNDTIPLYEMKCNHPFIFNLVDSKTGMIYLTSIINNPLG